MRKAILLYGEASTAELPHEGSRKQTDFVPDCGLEVRSTLRFVTSVVSDAEGIGLRTA